jgi:cytochrome c2
MVPDTKMALDGLDDPQQRADIIAYLKQFNQDGTKK